MGWIPGVDEIIALTALAWQMMPSPMQLLVGILLGSMMIANFGVLLMTISGWGDTFGIGGSAVWATNALTLRYGPLNDTYTRVVFASPGGTDDNLTVWASGDVESRFTACSRDLRYLPDALGYIGNIAVSDQRFESVEVIDCNCSGLGYDNTTGAVTMNCTGTAPARYPACESMAYDRCVPRKLYCFDETPALYVPTLDSPCASNAVQFPGRWFYVLILIALAGFALQHNAGGMFGRG